MFENLKQRAHVLSREYENFMEAHLTMDAKSDNEYGLFLEKQRARYSELFAEFIGIATELKNQPLVLRAEQAHKKWSDLDSWYDHVGKKWDRSKADEMIPRSVADVDFLTIYDQIQGAVKFNLEYRKEEVALERAKETKPSKGMSKADAKRIVRDRLFYEFHKQRIQSGSGENSSYVKSMELYGNNAEFSLDEKKDTNLRRLVDRARKQPSIEDLRSIYKNYCRNSRPGDQATYCVKHSIKKKAHLQNAVLIGDHLDWE